MRLRLLLSVVLAASVFASRAPCLAATTENLSLLGFRQAGNGQSHNPSISSDGRYVAFDSLASDLVAGDTNGVGDVFALDCVTGLMGRVSVATGGAEADGYSLGPAISGDGRYVAFTSSATNLVTGDTNGRSDVFVHDRSTGETTRVSVATGGAQSNGDSRRPSVTADGRYIAFESQATNLVAGDTNAAWDIFLHDRQTGETARVSVATGGAQSDSHSYRAAISGDGRYVAFESAASNLVTSDTNGASDIFVRDAQTGQTARASVASDGSEANGGSFAPSISADGRYVVFESQASDLWPNDTNGTADIFRHDRLTGQTVRVSVDSSGSQANGWNGHPSVSGDGRHVAFISDATNLVSGDTNGVSDIFLRDLVVGRTTRLSVSDAGEQGGQPSEQAAISSDGLSVAFESRATNLVPNDTNGTADVFRRDLSAWHLQLVSGFADPSSGDSLDPAVSSDGRYVVFTSAASNLVEGDSNNATDIFVFDRVTREVQRVNVATDGSEAQALRDSSHGRISADGRYVVFQSMAPNLAAGDTNNVVDVFVRDRIMDQTVRVSVATDGTQANFPSQNPAISGSGRYVAFESMATNLVAGDTNNVWDVFVHDLQTHQTGRTSLTDAGAQASAQSYRPSLSYDGRYVAFESLASNLVTGDTNGQQDIFVRDTQGSHTTRVSVSTAGVQADGDSMATSISGDGRLVSFQSSATNLVTGDTNLSDDIFVHDRQTAETTRLSIASDGTQADAASSRPGISSEGRYVAFESLATGLVEGDTNEAQDIFLRDLAAGLTTRVSLAVGGAQAAGASAGPSVTPYGRYVTFQSEAFNLVFGDDNGVVDVFLRDRVTFPDVPTTHWAFYYIGACVSAAIVTGYPDGTYKPDTAVNRGAMAVYIARALAGGDGNIPDPGPTPTFPDVAASHWAYLWVEYAFDQCVVSGYPDGTYRPDEAVNRAQMAVYISRALVGCAGSVPDPQGPPTFSDVSASHWAYKYVEYCSDQGVVQGYPDGTYHPDEAVNRGQMAVFVQKAFDLPL